MSTYYVKNRFLLELELLYQFVNNKLWLVFVASTLAHLLGTLFGACQLELCFHLSVIQQLDKNSCKDIYLLGVKPMWTSKWYCYIIRNIYNGPCPKKYNLSILGIFIYSRAILVKTIGTAFIDSCCVFAGLVMYAKYYDCDPISAKVKFFTYLI